MFRFLLTASGSVLLLCTSATAEEAAPDFSRDILPILSNNCFKCHGPDEANREAGLRLDQLESATSELDSGEQAIVSGNSRSSELMKRLLTDDSELKMPPSDSGKSLSKDQVEKIRTWIDAGAEWGGHWAFEPPVAPTIPPAITQWSPANPIDRFIHESLRQADLSPESRASRETLIRRVTLDLTGVPPTIEEIDAFLNDSSSNAYEKVVDRLLGSTRYAEHMSRIWLDAARYGDTHGLHLDNERSIWPYRDWVIESFRQNQRFDQFTVEQLAGDLLPAPSLSQRIATGFNRCNVTTSEGGSIDEEYYVRYAVDRVETTSTVWLGLTAGCAACHDHKFDPLTQREFYQLFSYYFSLTERAMDGNALLPPPLVKVPTTDQTRQKNEYSTSLAATRERVKQLIKDFDYKDPAPDQPLGSLTDAELVWIDDSLPAGANAQGNGPEPWKFVSAPEHPVFSGDTSTVRTATDDGITQHFFSDATDKLTIGENSRLFAHVYLDPDNPPETIQLQFNDGNWNHRATWGADKGFNAGRNDASNRMQGDLPDTGKWVRLEVTAEEVGLKPGAQLNGWAFTQVKGTVHWDHAGIVTTSLSKEQSRSLYAWEQFRKRDNLPAVPADIQKILDLERDKRNEAQSRKLTEYFLENIHPDARESLKEPRKREVTLAKQLANLEKAIPATLVMEDRKEPRQAHILERGEYTLKRDPVPSAVPTWIAPPVEGAPANRLGLAQWLTQPDHPLTSRVTVNRFWQQFFGTGIVSTSEDFGVQGEQPSHPELLDWLATDFVASGWDVQGCLKQIVMSSTYQQSSLVAAEKLAKDPENRLLARGPRFRLDAEVIRDQALFISHLLNPEVGGKSVKPYQPAGLWKPVGFGGSNTATFVQDKGEKLYRRSMYTFWKRTSPPPSMTTFDAPNRETCQVRRARTNTPLQALVLLNDIQFVEAARKFAERVLREGGEDDKTRLHFAFRSVLTRRPTASEQKSLLASLADYRSEFATDQAAAISLLSAGESGRDESLKAEELAAWTLVAHTLMNLSESITKE